MTRDYGAELDGLRREMEDLKQLLTTSHSQHTKEDSSKGDNRLEETLPTKSPHLKQAFTEAETARKEKSDTGAVSYVGTFSSGGRQSCWVSELVSTDFLLSLNEDQMAERVLSSVGNSQRLAILLALLKKPMTANQLVAELDLNTTGQAYHHLKSLAAADLIQGDPKEDKGVYVVVPHRVQGIIMLLAAVWDMIDPKYTSGTW